MAYSNCYYSILDDSSPWERVCKVIKTFAPKAIICLGSYQHLPDLQAMASTGDNDSNFACLTLEEINALPEVDAAAHAFIAERLASQIDTDVLYVLFTSGSTGEPKGVTICHKSVIDYIEWVCSTFAFDEHTVLLNQAPFYFDNSILDIYSTFKVGATLHIINSTLFSFPIQVINYMAQHHISSIFWVPSVLIYFANTKAVELIKEKNLLPDLRQVLFCGEVMPNKQLNEWRRNLPQCTYANLYGPTEITDVCAYYIADREFSDDEILPIGKACKNTQLLIFAEEETPADDGKPRYRLITSEQVGEKGLLFVRGTSLSLGYYNNEPKTKSSFIQNPLHSSYLDLIYNTGDIAAYNERGEILCFGRADNQIKYRGHRIELGEIESVVGAHAEVKSCACTFKEEIVLFYQAEHDIDFKSYLKDKLPHYMIPAQMVRVSRFQLNANGKIDRRYLGELVVAGKQMEIAASAS